MLDKLQKLCYPKIEVPKHKSRLKALLLSSHSFKNPNLSGILHPNDDSSKRFLLPKILVPSGLLVFVAAVILLWAGYVNENQAAVAPAGNIQARPLLAITTPLDNATVNGVIVTVQGKTEPGAVVSINDQITTADEQGDFSCDFSLDKGMNVINVTVSNDSGQQASQTIVVNTDGEG